MASITSRPEFYPVLDSDLFTFKPKLNEKSNEIAQNLLTNFYERQSKHTKRLQEFKEIAASNYREWYCHDKRSKYQPENNKSNAENQLSVNEPVSTDEKETVLAAPAKGARQFNDRLAQLIHAYGSSLPKRTKVPAALMPIRSTKRTPTGSAPLQIEAQEPATSPSSPPRTSSSSPPPLAPVIAPVTVRPLRRLPVIVRPRTPIKIVRQADSSPKRSTINETINPERLKLARDEAERAMKEHKIFTIIGAYPALRESLRCRGWIEKFDRALLFPSVHEKKKSDKKTTKSDDDDDDDTILGDADLDENPIDGDENEIPPWEENDGYYSVLSRLVKSAAPDLVWTVQASYDSSTLNKDQMVNHFERNGCLTTKVGLCSSLKNLPWFHSCSADEFYPRCYKLSDEDDRNAFIDDFRLTACISFLKLIRNRCKGIIESTTSSSLDMSLSQQLFKSVPSTFIEFALNKVEQFTLARDHEDIDIKQSSQKESTNEQWKQFIEQFYAASHSYAEIDGMKTYLNRIEQCLKNVEQHWPQYRIDGTRNMWISKPGAKSRGRGIVVYDRLDDVLKSCTSTVVDHAKFIVQKYIERPLLIHNTKFDIRQWFLVTDWNPLTIWMYKDCYLRFCTQHFSLATRHQNVHLCNYSIQKHYKNNASRHPELPAENMWTSPEFIEKYLRPKKLTGKWESLIYPAMKDAILCSMLVAQDTIEGRKNSFELFGADFMLGEDLYPWLIEINCSPTMARCTAVTKEMCDSVLEDTCKVIIDQKYDRTGNTGRFELIHKGAIVPVPNYLGVDLRVEGKICKTGRVYNSCATTNGSSNTNKTTASVSVSTEISTSKNASSDSKSSPTTIASVDNRNTSTTNQTSTDMNDSSLSSVVLMTEKPADGHINKISKSNLITISSPPMRPLSRAKTHDYLSSTKGNKDDNSSKINVGELVFEDAEVKSPGNLPFFRRLQNTLLLRKEQEPNMDTNTSKTLQRQATSLNSTTLDRDSTSSAPSALDTNTEHITVIPVS